MIQITERASGALADLIRGRPGAAGLRLSVSKGGCAGLQYDMETGGRRDGDLEFGTPGALVFVDPSSMAHLEGVTLDFEDGLTGAGFRIINPRAARSCGCGTSFEPGES